MDNLEFTFGSIDPNEFWSDRHDRFLRVKKSQEFYDGLDYTSRDVVIKLVRRGLMLAYDRVDEWLPDAFTFDDVGSLIGVEVKMLVTDIQEEVADSLRITSDVAKELIETLTRDLAELEDEV